MPQYMNITEARQRFLELHDALADGPLYVTRRGKPVLVVLRHEDYEAALETAEILADEAMVESIRASEVQIASDDASSMSAAEARERLLG